MRSIKHQDGQSMTEFVVSAAFVVVPLFLLVPTVAKYVDMKMAAVQAARYATWEYSAHYLDPKDQPAGFKALKRSELPSKSLQQVAKEAKRRHYSDSRTPISTSMDSSGYKAAEANPFWTYHNGLAIYQDSNQTAASLEVKGSDPTPDKLKIGSYALGIIGAITNVIAKLNEKMGVDAGFNAMNPRGDLSIKGLYSSQVAMQVEPAPGYSGIRDSKPLFINDLKLKMQARGGLLTEHWGAGGRAHSVYQSSGLVPTTYIDFVLNGWGIPLQTIASTVLISPELDKSSLKFGYPLKNPEVMDIVPADKLEDDDRKVECEGRYCRYEKKEKK